MTLAPSRSPRRTSTSCAGDAQPGRQATSPSLLRNPSPPSTPPSQSPSWGPASTSRSDCGSAGAGSGGTCPPHQQHRSAASQSHHRLPRLLQPGQRCCVSASRRWWGRTGRRGGSRCRSREQGSKARRRGLRPTSSLLPACRFHNTLSPRLNHPCMPMRAKPNSTYLARDHDSTRHFRLA